jgi:hypothetical protein
MSRVRRTSALLGALVAVTCAAACLVFDGRTATDVGDGGADATTDGLADSGADSPGSDADAGDANEDTSMLTAGDGGVVCGVNGSSEIVLCEAGLKCCAKLVSGKWIYASPSCDVMCSTADAGGGFYDYECADDNDCGDSGNICCAFNYPKNHKSPPPYANALCKSVEECASMGPSVELCQPDQKVFHTAHLCKTGHCAPGDRAYLPPHYYYCDAG